MEEKVPLTQKSEISFNSKKVKKAREHSPVSYLHCAVHRKILSTPEDGDSLQELFQSTLQC